MLRARYVQKPSHRCRNTSKIANASSPIVSLKGNIFTRGPQLLLSMPLALGAATPLVACSLALLTIMEALVVWQWWQPETFADPMRLAHVVEHHSVNLALGGALLLLPLQGSGSLTLDELLKKRD